MMTDTDTDIETTREAIADGEMHASHHLNSRVDFYISSTGSVERKALLDALKDLV